jgi:AraC-like DNA-binding protein
MPHSYVYTLADPYSYEAVVRALNPKLIVTSKGDFRAQLTKIHLQRLWIQRGEENLPRIMSAAVCPKGAAIIFHSDRKQGRIQVNGVEVSPGEVVVHRRDDAFHLRTSGSFRFAAMSLTHGELAVAGEAIAGHELKAPSNTCIIRPDPVSMYRLMDLHQAAGQLAKSAPDTLAISAIAEALEQDLVHAMVTCLTGHPQIETRYCSGQRSRIIARFENFLAARQYEPVYLPEMCNAISVAERTLRTCCHEYLGMGPARYLWLRRMHMARRTLLRADPQAATVTEVATKYGFWELGRFSVQYRALFGELPSVSLHRPPDQALGRKEWQQEKRVRSYRSRPHPSSLN